MPEIGMTTKGRWVVDTYKAVLRDGGTREDALSEVNRIMFPEEWAAALARGEVKRWVPKR